MNFARGIRLGSIAGIEIQVDWSLLIIFSLITFSLAGGVFPAWHPDWTPGQYWLTALAAAILFFGSVLAHELSHALVGRANGIVIRRITLFIFGGVAHMENEPRSWRAELAMAIVGPITSLVLGVLFVWLGQRLSGPIDFDPLRAEELLAELDPLPTLLMWLGPVNIVLGLFNLVPGFPLDGGRVLRAVMWGITGDLRRATRWASGAGQAFAWLLMATGFAMMLGIAMPFFGRGFVNGIWLAFIGWFLNNAALISYRQLLIRESLEDVPVSRLMHTRFARVPPHLPVRTLVDELLMASGQRAFPVEADRHFLGMVCLADLQKRDRAGWQAATVSEIMTPVGSLVTIPPDEDAAEALTLLGQRNLGQLPVVDDGRLVGLLRREDVLTWLSLHAGPELHPSGRSRHQHAPG